MVPARSGVRSRAKCAPGPRVPSVPSRSAISLRCGGIASPMKNVGEPASRARISFGCLDGHRLDLARRRRRLPRRLHHATRRSRWPCASRRLPIDGSRRNRGERIQRRHADERSDHRKRQPLHRRDPDTQAGERARTDSDREDVDVFQSQVGAGQELAAGPQASRAACGSEASLASQDATSPSTATAQLPCRVLVSSARTSMGIWYSYIIPGCSQVSNSDGSISRIGTRLRQTARAAASCQVVNEPSIGHCALCICAL